MSKKLIEILYDVAKIEEKIFENGYKKYIISGIYTVTDKPNSNNRIYPTAIMNEAVRKLQPKVMMGKVKMSMDHPDWNPTLKDTAAIMLDITEVGEDKKGRYSAQICDTQVGKDLKAILDAGGSVGVSTRGYGSGLDDQEWPGLPGRYTVIQPGFKLESVDFVDGPSVEETEDDITLEQKKGAQEDMKTIEELMKAYPEIFKGFSDKTEAEKKELVTKLNDAIKASNVASENFTKLTDTIKAIRPDMFVTVAESEIVKSKDSEISTLKSKISELESKIKESETKISTFESQKVKNSRDLEVQKLKAEDSSFFKGGVVEKKFENCVTADEVQQVYKATKELIESFKKSQEDIADPKTQTPDKKSEGNGLTKEQNLDFERKNMERRNSGLAAMTTESYKKLCI